MLVAERCHYIFLMKSGGERSRKAPQLSPSYKLGAVDQPGLELASGKDGNVEGSQRREGGIKKKELTWERRAQELQSLLEA